MGNRAQQGLVLQELSCKFRRHEADGGGWGRKWDAVGEFRAGIRRGGHTGTTEIILQISPSWVDLKPGINHLGEHSSLGLFGDSEEKTTWNAVPEVPWEVRHPALRGPGVAWQVRPLRIADEKPTYGS